jgi:hypothetical protein
MLPMLEDPVLGTERILPWVVSTHVKDGGLVLESDGLLSFPVAAGEGVIDLRAILDRLAGHDRQIHLSVEDHGGSFKTRLLDEDFLSRFPDLTELEMDRLRGSAETGRRRMEAGELVVTEREVWPSLCEERTRAGLANIQRLVEEMKAGSP